MRRAKVFWSFAVALLFSCSVVSAEGPKGGPSFETYEWTEIRPTQFFNPLHWEPRAGLQAVELHNRLFVIAGRSPKNTDIPRDSLIHGDVWASDDLGVNWVELLEDAESAGLWRNRAYFEAVTQGNHMYILGGQNFVAIPTPPFVCSTWPPELGPCPEFITVSDFFNDVWRSPDGVNWEEMSNEAPWEARAGLSAASFKGKLWVLAGSQNDDASIGGLDRKFFNDVWYSNDGSEWHAATMNAPWEARAGGVALVKGGWLYLLGGEKGFTDPADYFNDVWRTKDGEHWELVTDSAGWSPRPGHKCEVLADYFVCIGGFGFPFNPMDIWVSKDGAIWEQVSDSPWNASSPDDIRYDFDMLTVKGGMGGQKPSIFTFGGDRETFILRPEVNFFRVENDVWSYSPID
jgi:hypothetical protein